MLKKLLLISCVATSAIASNKQNQEMSLLSAASTHESLSDSNRDRCKQAVDRDLDKLLNGLVYQGMRSNDMPARTIASFTYDEKKRKDINNELSLAGMSATNYLDILRSRYFLQAGVGEYLTIDTDLNNRYREQLKLGKQNKEMTEQENKYAAWIATIELYKEMVIAPNIGYLRKQVSKRAQEKNRDNVSFEQIQAESKYNENVMFFNTMVRNKPLPPRFFPLEHVKVKKKKHILFNAI